MHLDQTLKLQRCPFCSVHNPNLVMINTRINTQADNGTNSRTWGVYRCMNCGSIVTAQSQIGSYIVDKVYPDVKSVNDILPFKVKSYLQQAIDSVYTPAGSIMLCASAVDAMLKEKGYLKGSLYTRVDSASKDNLITDQMAIWAHQVRLDANEQRHADVDSSLPTVEEAQQAIEFTETLAEFLFVLPSKVTRGIQSTGEVENTKIE